MTTFQRLKIEARNSAENHGHRMGRFITVAWHTSGATLAKSGPSVATAICKDCGAYVQINTHPRPNEIDIGGTVYSHQCIHRDNVYTSPAF